MTDRRGVLESIAYGEDPEIRVGDRLRALELLAQLDELALEELLFRDTARMSPEETDVALDSGMAVILGEILAGRGEEIVEDYPRTLDVVESALDRRAREIAFELGAADELAYVPAREPEPIAPALATEVEIEKRTRAPRSTTMRDRGDCCRTTGAPTDAAATT